MLLFLNLANSPEANYIICEIAQDYFPEGLVQMAMIGGGRRVSCWRATFTASALRVLPAPVVCGEGGR